MNAVKGKDHCSNDGRSFRPTAIDLFSGAGGLSLGFEQSGFDISAAVELDPIHASIHELNFPQVAMICRDIRELSGADIRARAGLEDREIDCVFGGPPCQGFSLIGYRILEDSRNELVFHFLRLVMELQPRVFMMENVPGMATGRHTALLEELIDGFRVGGYKVRLPYRVLNAASYGVPQNRRRLFLLGARKDVDVPQYPPSSTEFPTGPPSNAQLVEPHTAPTVADAISDLPDIDRFEELLGTDELRIRLGRGSAYARVLRGESKDPADYSYVRDYPPDLLTGCLRARHTRVSRNRFACTLPGRTEPVSRFFKLSWDGLCNTLRSGTGSDRGAFSAPRPIHPSSPRCISVREAARLHSYPDWFRFHRTIWHGFRQIGNSVPPLLARAVGASLMKALGEVPVRPAQVVVPGPPELATFNMRTAAQHFGVRPDIIPPRRRLTVVAS